MTEKRPRPAYELEDLNRTPIDVPFYQEEMNPVRISKQTAYKMDNRTRRGIREYLVRWRDYSQEFDSLVLASIVMNIWYYVTHTEPILRDCVQ